MAASPFWASKSLEQLSNDEWEQLCDGCGRCCVHKFQDEESGELLYTNVACKLLDCETSRCTDYTNRAEKVPGCMKISPAMLRDSTQREWLPNTCAYRLLAEGKPLFDWHPLVHGSNELMIQEDIALAGTLVSETDVDLKALEDSL